MSNPKSPNDTSNVARNINFDGRYKVIKVAPLSSQSQRVMSHPWDQNEHGLWCSACGEHIAAASHLDNEISLPENCKTCGFPDFENGHGYFTDGEES